VKYIDKIVLVTGASRGIGAHIAGHLLSNGASVIGLSRTRYEREGNYTHYLCDLSDPDNIRLVIKDIAKSFGRIDILINNAAVLTSQYSMIMPVSKAVEMIKTNLLGVFFTSREVAKVMRKGKQGRIINIGSMAASLEPVGDSIYAATKAAVETLANVMAKEFGQLNITCNTIGITAIETDMLSQLPKDKIDDLIKGLPIPRYALPDDIFNVIDFFSSDRSSYISAQTIYLGGVN